MKEYKKYCNFYSRFCFLAYFVFYPSIHVSFLSVYLLACCFFLKSAYVYINFIDILPKECGFRNPFMRMWFSAHDFLKYICCNMHPFCVFCLTMFFRLLSKDHLLFHVKFLNICPNTEFFPVFTLNTEIYGLNLCIQFEYRKIRIRKNSAFEQFLRSDILNASTN